MRSICRPDPRGFRRRFWDHPAAGIRTVKRRKEAAAMEMISEMLSYPFLVRALVGGLMVSLCASLLGVSLVLK